MFSTLMLIASRYREFEHDVLLFVYIKTSRI